jgi:hypothetical protein
MARSELHSLLFLISLTLGCQTALIGTGPDEVRHDGNSEAGDSDPFGDAARHPADSSAVADQDATLGDGVSPGDMAGCDPVAAEVCDDHVDNDCDGDTDAADTECPAHYQGFGAQTAGGSGGVLLWVDASLGDPAADDRPCTYDEPCALRTALLTAEPRVVKVKVGGTVNLSSRLRLRDSHSFLTFDGASAPSPGVTIRANYPLLFAGRPSPAAPVHDILINHMRYVGTGDGAGVILDGEEGGIYNVVLDHFTWTLPNKSHEAPKTVLWYAGQDVTISHSLFYDAYKGLQVSGIQGARVDDAIERVSIHHNLFYNISHRQPIVRSHVRELDLVNNMMLEFNFKFATDTVTRIRNRVAEHSPTSINIIGNVYRSSNSDNREQFRAIIFGETDGDDSDEGGPSTCAAQGEVITTSRMGEIWVAGNILPASNCDHYSTVSAAHARPERAALTPESASSLCSNLAEDVGMQHHNSRELEIIAAVLAGCE